MTDNGDGTFSSDYTVSVAGAVTVSVELLKAGGIYAEYFNNQFLSGAPVASQIESEINHNWYEGQVTPLTNNDYVSAHWYGKIYIPATDSYTFYISADDSANLLVDN